MHTLGNVSEGVNHYDSFMNKADIEAKIYPMLKTKIIK